jgi:hypothetical protein
VSTGVNVVESVSVPTGRILPTAGLYAKLPTIEAVAFNCVVERAVPEIIDAGVTQVIDGVALLTDRFTDAD